MGCDKVEKHMEQGNGASRKRIGIFGWGLVAPKSPNIQTFRDNLRRASTWLTPFQGFGPNNFLVGQPDFRFEDYKPWINARFEPRKFSQLEAKMGNAVKYAIGAYIQSLSKNPELESLMQELGNQTHIYVGSGLGDYPVIYKTSIEYYKAQKRWNRFWCQPAYHGKLEMYAHADDHTKREMREALGAPEDPAGVDEYDPNYDDICDAWYAFWVGHSEGLKVYLRKVREVESLDIKGDIDVGKSHMIRHKQAARRKINQAYRCPTEPWASVNPNILWNIPNIPGAQISMLGRITGPAIAPIGACAGFVSSLKLAEMAIRLDEAKVCVVGMTDAEPNPLTVGGFFGARVIAHDGQASKPLTGLRGTHISGGACIWIVGDYDYLTAKGMKPVGLELIGIGMSSDAHHIITPNAEGPRAAIQQAMDRAEVTPEAITTWDMHATATPGDWTELTSAIGLFPRSTYLTARKGSFGHGMSVCGGWELTAQHLGLEVGEIMPVNVEEYEFHEMIRPYADQLVTNHPIRLEQPAITGKINMGVGGINGCVICKPWAKTANIEEPIEKAEAKV